MDNLITTDSAFDPQAVSTITELLDMMLPEQVTAQGTMPSGSDPLIAAECLKNLFNSVDLVKDAVTFINTRLAGGSLIAMNEQERQSFLQVLWSEKQSFMSEFQFQGISSYYRDARVMALLGLEARPPHPGGYPAPETDWSLLAPVKARGSIYRLVE